VAIRYPGLPLVLAGFSFGSWVGLRAGCEDQRVMELIGLGIPVNNVDFLICPGVTKPKLFVHGSNDEFGNSAKAREFVALLPGDNRFVEVKRVDHFFAGKLNELDAAVTDWMLERHPELSLDGGLKSHPFLKTLAEFLDRAGGMFTSPRIGFDVFYAKTFRRVPWLSRVKSGRIAVNARHHYAIPRHRRQKTADPVQLALQKRSTPQSA